MKVSPSGRLDNARRAVGRAFHALRRRPSRDSLRNSAAILKAQQEATADGILAVDLDGRILSYNDRFLEIWGIPSDVAARSDDNELLGYASELVADWDAFIEQVNYLYTHPDEVRTNDPVLLKDGRILSRTSVPVVADGKIAGRAWYFRDISETRQSEAMQSALFRIAQLSRESIELGDFYKAVHGIIGTLMDATNFYVAEYDESRNILNFPYFVDQMDPAPEGRPPGRGLTAYVLRTGKPLLATPEKFAELIRAGEVDLVGAQSVDWLGAPLKTGERTWGVIGIQTYAEAKRYGDRDREILLFVAQHVAAVIEQKRQENALRENERRYRQMFENNRAVQLLIDPQAGTIVDANVAAAEFYGYRREELRGMSVWTINTLGEEAVREEMAAAVSQKRSYFRFRHRLAGGELRDVEVHAGPIQAGGRSLLYSIVHDVTERKHAEEALLHSEEKYRNIFNFASVGIYQSTLDGRLITANLTLSKMLGYDSVEELLARNMGTDVYYHSGQREENIRRFAPRGYAADLELLWKKRDGSPIWIQLNAHALASGDDGTLMFEGFVIDITERKLASEKSRQQSAAMTAAMDGIGILNERLDFTYSNDALAKLFGYSDPDLLLGRSLCDLYEPPEQVRIVTAVLPIVQQRGRWRGEATGLRRDGVTFPQEISITAIENGGMVCVVRDITERTYAEEQIKHLAYHDALTGMPNRLLFRDRVTVALSHAQRDGSRLAILFLDLDRFKVINDSLGHNIGDQLLQAVAERIHACVRDSDTVARLGGDEFTLLLPNLARSEDAAVVAQKILETIRQPFQIDGRELFASTSIGISVYPEDGLDAATLIKAADTAMYQAKEQGRDNVQLFNAYVSARALQRIALEHGLRRALSGGELSLHYQPIFDFRSNAITGMEALMRWQHPDLGNIPPTIFIPLAEAIGVAVPIGMWALRTACAQAKAWHDAGFCDLTLAVNLSVCQLQHPDLVRGVREILEESGLPAGLLELEITESSAMQNPETSARTLYELKHLGIRISLDDFGTGHSSLSYLKRFPIDTLKIDQSFVRDINSDPDTAAIVHAIIAMGHSLRLKVIAEGVETSEQAMFLQRCNCDQMQGFLIQAPVEARDFAGLLAV